MFKQQAKDLTNVSQLTSTAEAMEAARMKLLRTLTTLRKLVALDESKVEMLTHRVQRKKQSVDELNAAVVALEAEKQLNNSAPDSLACNVFHVWDSVSTTFMVDGEPMQPLLAVENPSEEARFPELDDVHQNIETHRKRWSLLDAMLQQLQDTSAIPDGLGPLIREWSKDPDYASSPLFAPHLLDVEHSDNTLAPHHQSDDAALPLWSSLPPFITSVEKHHKEASLLAGKIGLTGPDSIKEPLCKLRQCLVDCSSAAEAAAGLDKQVEEASLVVLNWQRQLVQAVNARLAEDNALALLEGNKTHCDSQPQPTCAAAETIFGQHAALIHRASSVALDDAVQAEELQRKLRAQVDDLLSSIQSLDLAEAQCGLDCEEVAAQDAATLVQIDRASSIQVESVSIDAACVALLEEQQVAERFTAAVLALLKDNSTTAASGGCFDMQSSDGRNALFQACHELNDSAAATAESSWAITGLDPASSANEGPVVQCLTGCIAALSAISQAAHGERLLCESRIATLQSP